MSRDNIKSIKRLSAEVSKDCWKKLKIISIQKEITVTKVVEQILERAVGNNKKSIVIDEAETVETV